MPPGIAVGTEQAIAPGENGILWVSTPASRTLVRGMSLAV